MINTEIIVDAAIAIIKRDGPKALSMRSLAGELGVTTMAAYYHVPNKQALIELVVNRLFSTMSTKNLKGTGKEKLHHLFWTWRDNFLIYPEMVLYGATSARIPQVARVQKEVNEVFQEAGLDRERIEVAYRLVGYLQYGSLIHEGATATMTRKTRKAIDNCLSTILRGLSL